MSNAPLIVLLAAGPTAPGAEAVLTESLARAAAGQPVEILLSHAGLQWAGDPRLEQIRKAPGTRVGVCSRQASAAGWTLAEAPAGIGWTALIAWIREARAADAVWTVLP